MFSWTTFVHCFLSFASGVSAISESCGLDDELSLLQATRYPVSSKSESEIKRPPEVSRDFEYPWSQRGRDYTTSSFTPYDARSEFSGGPTWTWSNEDDEEVRHSPLIDNNKDIYVSTGWKIRKFSSTGSILWALDTDKIVSAPALYEGALYAVSKTSQEDPVPRINLLSIDMASGSILLNKSIPRMQDVDASSVFVYNGIVIFPVFPDSPGAASATVKMHNVYAANASDGSFLWEYAPDDSLWNFSPSTPGDGTLLFAGGCGRVYRITFGGTLLWKHGPNFPGEWCGTGGGALGSNGVFYSEYNDLYTEFSNQTAHLDARRVSDGRLLWTKDFPSEYWGKGMGNQYPAVGNIGDAKRVAVVAALGPNPGLDELIEPLPEALWMPNAVVALDAETGKLLWRYDEPKWPHMVAEGDGERNDSKPKTDPHCLPDNQGIPLIAGDGTVYMSSSHWGALRAIRDRNGDGVIGPEEVSTFSTRKCFLNSPSLAQDMLVAAPCFGPMYVFRD